jgi:hypothetical protein
MSAKEAPLVLIVEDERIVESVGGHVELQSAGPSPSHGPRSGTARGPDPEGDGSPRSRIGDLVLLVPGAGLYRGLRHALR